MCVGVERMCMFKIGSAMCIIPIMPNIRGFD